MRSAGQIDTSCELTPPHAIEVEYLLRGGAPDPAESEETAAAPPEKAPHRDRPDIASWLVVESNLAVCRNRKQALSVLDPNLRSNNLHVMLGPVATWTLDAADPDHQYVAGPSYHTLPNVPKVLAWSASWPAPAVFGLPDRTHFELHDLKGYWPWQRVALPSRTNPENHVGLYLVLRPVSTLADRRPAADLRP